MSLDLIIKMAKDGNGISMYFTRNCIQIYIRKHIVAEG